MRPKKKNVNYLSRRVEKHADIRMIGEGLISFMIFDNRMNSQPVQNPVNERQGAQRDDGMSGAIHVP